MRRWVILAVVCSTLSLSCIAPYSAEMVAVAVGGWSEPARIVVENSDTVSLRNLSVAVRYNSSFKGEHLPLRVKILTPDGRLFEEEQQFVVRRSYTAAAISAVESMPYRADVSLSMSGAYIFVFEPMTELKGVEAIGVEIESR